MKINDNLGSWSRTRIYNPLFIPRAEFLIDWIDRSRFVIKILSIPLEFLIIVKRSVIFQENFQFLMCDINKLVQIFQSCKDSHNPITLEIYLTKTMFEYKLTFVFEKSNKVWNWQWEEFIFSTSNCSTCPIQHSTSQATPLSLLSPQTRFVSIPNMHISVNIWFWFYGALLADHYSHKY